MITSPIREAIKTHYNGRCQYCGASDANEVDHIVPQSKGGSHDLENLTLSCGPCNNRKSAIDLPPLWGSIAAAHAVKSKQKIEASVFGKAKKDAVKKSKAEHAKALNMSVSFECRGLVRFHGSRDSAISFVENNAYQDKAKEVYRDVILEALRAVPMDLEYRWLCRD